MPTAERDAQAGENAEVTTAEDVALREVIYKAIYWSEVGQSYRLNLGATEALTRVVLEALRGWGCPVCGTDYGPVSTPTVGSRGCPEGDCGECDSCAELAQDDAARRAEEAADSGRQP